MAERDYLTLAADVVGTVEVDAAADRPIGDRETDMKVTSVKVACLEGSSPVYFRVDGEDPVAATTPAHWVLAGGEVEVSVDRGETATVKAISAATATLAVEAVSGL